MIDIYTMKSALLVNVIISGEKNEKSNNWNIFYSYSWTKYILSDYVTQLLPLS